jgi:hypothetical protein
MDEQEVRRIIEHAMSIGFDPGKVLGWRLNFAAQTEPRFQRPKGMLSMGEAKEKHSLQPAYLRKPRHEHGLPTTMKGILVLVQEATLRKWMKRFPPSDTPRGRQRKPAAPDAGQ